MEIIPFEPVHLAGIDPPVMSAAQLEVFAESYHQRGPAFTATENSKVLGCAGVVIEGDTGKCWAFLNDPIRERPILLHRAVVRGLHEIEETHDLRRVVATVHAQFHRAHAWLQRLGFRFERHLPDRLGTGQNYLEFVK